MLKDLRAPNGRCSRLLLTNRRIDHENVLSGDRMISKTMRSLIWVFLVAVMLNYLWELAQAALYVGLECYDPTVFWHCFVASLGDGIIVLLIVAAGWIFFQRWDWFQWPGVAGYLLMLFAGLILAVLVEWVGMHILGRWAYTEKMPTVPWARANGHSSAGDIPHSGSLGVKKT
jgi:hypothetical protein